MKAHCEFRVAFLATAVLVSGCAQDGTLTTGSLNAAPDPACVTLAAQLKTLEDQGVPEKVAMAAKKKYKLKPSDLAKVAQLNKANAEFQAKCSNMPQKPNVAAAPANAKKNANVTAKSKAAAKKIPPIPVHKPRTASLGTTNANTQAHDKPGAAQPPLETGTAETAPPAEDKPEAAQPPLETGTAATAPPAENKPEAAPPPLQMGTTATAPPAEETPEAAQPPVETGTISSVPPAQ